LVEEIRQRYDGSQNQHDQDKKETKPTGGKNARRRGSASIVVVFRLHLTPSPHSIRMMS
jgi:hypothetical protein